MKQQYIIREEPHRPRRIKINSKEKWASQDVVLVTSQGYYYVVQAGISFKKPKKYRAPFFTHTMFKELKRFISEKPELMLKEDLLKLAFRHVFFQHEIEEIHSRLNSCLDEMAREKTGFLLDEQSKTMLRNELVLGVLQLLVGYEE